MGLVFESDAGADASARKSKALTRIEDAVAEPRGEAAAAAQRESLLLRERSAAAFVGFSCLLNCRFTSNSDSHLHM